MKEDSQGSRPRSITVAITEYDLHHAGGAKIPSDPISHQDSSHTVREVVDTEALPL